MPRIAGPLALFPALALLAAAATSLDGHAGPLPISRPQMEAMGLSFAQAEAAEWVPVARLPATVELAPDSRTIVAARHEGSVRRARVVEGESVSAGQPLLELASPGWAESLAAAAGRAARLAALERQARRSADLFAAGVIAPREDEAVRAELAALRAEVRADADGAKSGRLDPAGVVIVEAPVAGRVVHRAGAGSAFTVGATLVEIASGDALIAEAQAPARLAGHIAPGMRATTPAGAVGEVLGVASAIDPMTRSLAVTVRLPAGSAVPGALLEVDVARRADSAVTRVPASAVIAVSGRESVFVRGPRGIEPVAVEVLLRDGREAYVSGIEAGAEVVARGVLALKAVAEGAGEPAGAP
jgi:RND family efflux transporter MFP subunit